MTVHKQRNECKIIKIVSVGKEVTNDSDISQAFNAYFTSIGVELVAKLVLQTLMLFPTFLQLTKCLHLVKLMLTVLIICLKLLM